MCGILLIYIQLCISEKFQYGLQRNKNEIALCKSYLDSLHICIKHNQRYNKGDNIRNWDTLLRLEQKITDNVISHRNYINGNLTRYTVIFKHVD